MNVGRVREILEKVPATLILVVYLGYLGSDYYSYLHDENSPLQIKKKEMEDVKAENIKLQKKIKDAEAFLKALEPKKVELRRLAAELQSMKGTLSESLNLKEFIETVDTEAKRVGLHVNSIRPGPTSTREYYAEQLFELDFKGVYVQLILFLERMSNVQKIVRVDNFDIHPKGSSTARFIDLEGKVQIKAYHYIASKADSLGHDDAAPAGGPAKPPAEVKKGGG